MPIYDYKCDCKTCVAMCRRAPCWGTPKEMAAIIAAGYADRLCLDWRTDKYKGKEFYVSLLRPAAKGGEGQRAPFFPSGECTFLTADGKCELHDKGLKPLEGRAAVHPDGERPGDLLMGDDFNLRKFIAMGWRSKEAIALTEWFQL